MPRRSPTRTNLSAVDTQILKRLQQRLSELPPTETLKRAQLEQTIADIRAGGTRREKAVVSPADLVVTWAVLRNRAEQLLATTQRSLQTRTARLSAAERKDIDGTIAALKTTIAHLRRPAVGKP